MGGAREKVQADFDLERFIDMFDEALTSRDERVVNALRSLMMMVVLTKPEGRDQAGDGDRGPLRQLFNDMHNLNRRMQRMEEDMGHVSRYLQRSTEASPSWKYDVESAYKRAMQDEYIKTFTNKFPG